MKQSHLKTFPFAATHFAGQLLNISTGHCNTPH